MMDCDFSGDSVEDVVYSRRHVFNQEEIVHFDTNIKKFEGYTADGVRTAEEWNKDTARLASMVADKDRYCKGNFNLIRNGTADRRVPPRVKVVSTKHTDSQHPTLLVCHAMDFYPPRMTVTWLRNGLEQPDVTSSEMLPHGDWTYQVHVYLETTPQPGDRYTCRVQHSSLGRPLEVDWDRSLAEGKRNKIIIGTSGLVLGLIIALAGGVYYKKKKSAGTQLFPTPQNLPIKQILI
ncbi:HB2D protein, partial [Atractosteus spatula]|nr:HB2D protein [Atractosteus spatula]